MGKKKACKTCGKLSYLFWTGECGACYFAVPGWKRDRDAIARDWQTVGDDIRKAINNFAKAMKG